MTHSHQAHMDIIKDLTPLITMLQNSCQLQQQSFQELDVDEIYIGDYMEDYEDQARSPN